MTTEKTVRLDTEKYGPTVVYCTPRPARECYSVTIYVKSPLHLYDFVQYRSSGWGWMTNPRERVWMEEYEGEDIFTKPINMRFDLDFDTEPVLTEEFVTRELDKIFQESIEEYDGVVGFEKIVRVK